MSNRTLLTVVKQRIKNKYPKAKLGADFAKGVVKRVDDKSLSYIVDMDHIDLAILEGMKLLTDTYEAERSRQ